MIKKNKKKIAFIFLLLWVIHQPAFSEALPIEASAAEESIIKTTFSHMKSEKISQLEEKEKKLNKIFFSPEERKKLDARKEILYQNLKFTQFIKNNAISFSENKNTSTPASTNTVEKNDVYFKGIVKRSDGKNFIWVNQKKTQASNLKKSGESFALEDSLAKKLSNGVYEVELKPGQIWLKNGEKVSEGYLLFDASTIK